MSASAALKIVILYPGIDYTMTRFIYYIGLLEFISFWMCRNLKIHFCCLQLNPYLTLFTFYGVIIQPGDVIP